MLSAIIAIAISLLIGGVAYVVTNSNIPTGNIKVSLRELIIGGIISTVVLLIAAPLAEHLILDGQLTYHEFYNGYETAAVQSVDNCTRDGDCQYTYDCDPYPVVHTYTDSKGHTHTYVTTEYHQCPYLTQEVSYTIDTTLGNYNIGGDYATAQRTAWRAGVGVPGDIPIGPPTQWLQAQQRIAAGKNGGVTQMHTYQNFLLASDVTNLMAYSDNITQYQKKGLIPAPTTNFHDPIYNYYMADKFHAVSVGGVNSQQWNEYLSRLNGYLGMQLQGDLHLVAVNATSVGNPDTYANALFAYWKDSPVLGKYAISKNALAVVVGVHNSKIAWARATGGLPVGNEALFTDIENSLVGVNFTPDAVLGIPKYNGKSFTPGTGVLAGSIWGVHKFKRPCMTCNQGYAYLKSSISISGWARFWIIFIAATLSAVMWAAFLYTDDSMRGRYY